MVQPRDRHVWTSADSGQARFCARCTQVSTARLRPGQCIMRDYEELAEEVRLYGIARECAGCGTSWTPVTVRACPTCGEETRRFPDAPATPEATACEPDVTWSELRGGTTP